MNVAFLTNTRARFLMGSTLAAALVPLGCAASRPAIVNAGVTPPTAPAAEPVAVKLAKTNSGFQLLRGGTPYFIKGAGGEASKESLKAAGANSWRTWGADNLDSQLADAQKLGMTVTVGIWLGHKDQGFNYSDAAAVAAQKEMARKAIQRYKDSPALLVWSLGNEMETGGEDDDPAMWNAVEDIARMAHQLDPNHPTMTVVAELGADKIKQLNTHCPDIDIVGINTYAGGPSIAARYKAAGGVKPFIVTEYGPPGTWEGQKNAFGVVPELTSTEKAARYAETYTKSIENQPLCLGSYAFTWGNKQEASATWFGLLLPDGSKTEAVDTLTQLWTGKKPANLSPAIQSLTLTGPDQAAPGTTIHAALSASDPEKNPLAVTWILQAEPKAFGTGGVGEAAPPTYPEAITASSSSGATVKLPEVGGAYRLYAYVRDGHGGAAVANVPLQVTGGKAATVAAAPKAALPLTLLGDGAGTPYIPAGYMGNSGAIKMDPAFATNPHSGKTCLQAMYTAGDSWGGVVWQNPDNNWGDKPGGFNLTGAKALTFWARGDKGGEKVNFSFGLIGKDKPFSDTASGKLDGVTLSKDWTKYTIDLTGKDMSRIVTGFCWVVAGTGSGEVFYLDDIRYE